MLVVAFLQCTCVLILPVSTFFAHNYAIAVLLSFLMISKYIDTATASNGENTFFFLCMAHYTFMHGHNKKKFYR